jgi:7-keto-8-aminopelargonate synthetase-like enzyme
LLFGAATWPTSPWCRPGCCIDGDVCVQDKLNHACLIDGATARGLRAASAIRMQRRRRRRAPARRAWRRRPALLATDGVFSMDGDLAPLRALPAIGASARHAATSTMRMASA